MDSKKFYTLVATFEAWDIKVSDFITFLLSTSSLQNNALVHDLCINGAVIAFAINAAFPFASTTLSDVVFQRICDYLKEETQNLISQSEKLGWQFGAMHAQAEQVKQFRIDDMARQMTTISPRLWHLIGSLISSKFAPEDFLDVNISDLDAIDDSELTDLQDIGGMIQELTEDKPAQEAQKIAKEKAIIALVWKFFLLPIHFTKCLSIKKTVTILSIIMHSRNRKVNAFETTIGLFLHSCRTPEKVINVLAHLGISISINSIHRAVDSLSAESASHIRALGQSLLVAWAYDNFDVDLKSSAPTIEKSGSTLRHLTSALLYPLQHDVQLEDLKCSEELWKRSRLNPNAEIADVHPKYSWKDLIIKISEVHPDAVQVVGGIQLDRQARFRAWKYLYDLCHHGPAYFSQFCSELRQLEPEAVDQIPLVKTPIIPARSMEFSNSTVAGNISTIINLMNQGGVGDPDDLDTIYEVKDGMLYMFFFHGDLGTGDRILSIQLRRSIEKSLWNRFQYVVFVPGLFHVKMACVDSLWRLFIMPSVAREDKTSLMKDIGILRPKETGIMGSRPGFRRMHDTILHAGICRRLDCWREEVMKRNPSHDSLSAFAQSSPSFDDLVSLANYIACAYVPGVQARRHRNKSTAERDEQYENALLLNKCFMHYEDIIFGMNQGDIGRVECSLLQWIFIFRATGKHKYASHITHFLSDLHFVFPPRMRRAARLNWLVNPTGQAGKFRAVDWCVELNNLFTKAVHGGDYSNYTVERIIKESPLVEIYRQARASAGQQFALTNLTSTHADADMTKTYKVLASHLKTVRPHTFQPGRKSKYALKDPIDQAREIMDKDGSTTTSSTDNHDEVEGETPDSVDIIGELVN